MSLLFTAVVLFNVVGFSRHVPAVAFSKRDYKEAVFNLCFRNKYSEYRTTDLVKHCRCFTRLVGLKLNSLSDDQFAVYSQMVGKQDATGKEASSKLMPTPAEVTSGVDSM